MNNPFHIHCPHFISCSGCVLNESIDKPPILNEMRSFFYEKGGFDLPLLTITPTGWRTRAKLAVRGSFQQPLIGLYKKNSHEVTDIPFCKVHHPSVNLGVEALKAGIKEYMVEPYIEENGKGILRYLQFVIERSSGKISATLVINQKEISDSIYFFVDGLWKQNPSLFHSIWINCNTSHTNEIFGSDWQLIKGDALLWEHLGGVDICFQPANFAQANLEAFEELLKKVNQLIPSHASVAEFYAGVGVIGLSIVNKVKRVICVEVSPQAKSCFEKSRLKLSPQDAKKIEFHTGKAESFCSILNETDFIIVDPPRKGVDRSLLESFDQNQILYISCGWKGFQKDAELLLKKGYKIKKAYGYLFFPGTNHVELLVLLEK